MKDLQKLVGNLNKSGALNGFLGGVAGGGLTSLMGGKSKKSSKKAVKYGALAAVGGLAWKAYKQYSEQGFEVLGYPCNQFGGQEPSSDQEIEKFCQINYDVTFPLFSKIEVKGPSAHPLFKFLASSKPGLLGTQAIKWNFTKFLINRNGEPVRRYSSKTTPAEISSEILKLLEK